MQIKNVILDLGGVLLPIDYSAPVNAFKKLGISDFNAMFSQANQIEVFDDFEKGLISPSSFRKQINAICQLNLSDSDIDLAWNSILLEFPLERKYLLEQLGKKYQLYLLSNTNEIHIRSFEKSIENKFGNNFFIDVFDKIYYSSRIGMRKPDKSIFEFVLNENKLIPEETLFIDDSVQHVNGALLTGIKAHWLDTSKNTTEQLLNELKVI